MERHPIQLVDISVEELYIKVLDRSSVEGEDVPREFTLTVSRSDYNSSNKTISVKLQMEMIPDEETPKRPFEMRVVIAGHFEVDEDNFPMQSINHFAEKNAPIMLIPFIREQSYALSVRAGVEPMIFPLVTVPMFQVAPSSEAQAKD